MFKQKNLLKNEYFPGELPPCFTTAILADHAQTAIEATNLVKKNCSIPLTISGFKSEGARRRLALPNPYHYCKAIDYVVSHEDEIKSILQKSKYSLTAPINRNPKENEPYAKKTPTIADTKREIEKQFQDNQYEIRLDISSFFDSIYTHSIPWAIYGIEEAKKNKKDKTLWGNQLDDLMEALNYKQTNGILIGNALSRIISEIILCSVDEEIQNRLPELVCRRFVDDYYIYTKDSSQVKEIIAVVRNALAKYQLYFNESKIAINESPFIYGKPWLDQTRLYLYLSADVYLSRLISEYEKYKDIAIFKYGLKVLSVCKFSHEDWPVVQSRLINLWVRFPSLSDRLLPIFRKNNDRLNKRMLKKAIYGIIDESILLKHSQELIWAVWYVKLFGLKISQSYALKVLKSENDLAIIIMLDILAKQNLLDVEAIKKQRSEIRHMLEEANDPDSEQKSELMWSSHWLLAYEAERRKWLKFPGSPFELVKKNPFFKRLIEDGVYFYDDNYTYNPPNKEVAGKYSVVSYADLNRALNRLKKALISHMERGQQLQEEQEEENRLFEEFVYALENDEKLYW